MIKGYVKGNLVTILTRAVEDKDGGGIVIAHGCNCHDAMHSGIAWELQRTFPTIREADTKFFNEITDNGLSEHLNVAMIGHSSAAIIGNSVVVNLYTQYYPGRSYDAEIVRLAFEHLENKKIKGNVYIPRIGAGIAGGDWNEIVEIINQSTPNTNIIVIDWDGTIHDDQI